MLIVPGMWAIAYSFANRTSNTGSLPVARIASSSSVVISGVSWPGSSSVVWKTLGRGAVCADTGICGQARAVAHMTTARRWRAPVFSMGISFVC
jgi:hypothetical protein